MMEDFDIFKDDDNFVKSDYRTLLSEFVKDRPTTPFSGNYQSSQRLMGEECFIQNEEDYGFHFSESVSAAVRTLAIYREDQHEAENNDQLNLISLFANSRLKIDPKPIDKEDEHLKILLDSKKVNLSKNSEIPFHKQYMRFGPHNNVKNLLKILEEMPKEWTIVQLTARYNPQENVKPFEDYKTEIDSIFITLFTNDYTEKPMTVSVPANVTKEGIRPLFQELYSLLFDNTQTIDNAQYLNNKRLIRNYWSRREEIDLRMKSVINVMDKEWLGGWNCLLTGKLVDSEIRNKIIQLVDSAISDWGFIKLTTRQKILLYNLMDSCALLQSQQIKSCIRQILTENGNTDELRNIRKTIDCKDCSKEFRFPNELCLKCLSQCFEKIHMFTLVDGIKAFSQVATQIKENDEWNLKKAKRLPVILIVDELLDSFPWESLPALNQYSISRVENIHMLYSLYKTHQQNIVDGYFETKAEVGRYVINPDKDLERMQLRMTSFVRYWCAAWSGRVAEPPSPAELMAYLTDADLFLYCGHGDGCKAVCVGGVAGAGAARCCCLLSGCGSVRLVAHGPRAPPAAPHHHLHIAKCPCVVGMLWEVTDMEVDKMVSTLVALSVPSDAPHDWKHVGKAKWSQGELDTNVEPKIRTPHEKDLLQALCKARNATNFLMISTSIVARGLPVRIID